MSPHPDVPVAVIGLNPRGAALARALVAGGHDVLVWDEDVADATAAPGARAAEDLRAVFSAADAVVMCVEDYDAARRLVDQVGPALADHDLVNLTSGSSAQADELAELVTTQGGRYLDGALMAHPEHVGNPETVLAYSGSEQAFRRVEPLLARFGQAHYLGPQAGTASLYDAAMLNFAWATLTGFLYTAALLRSGGVRAASVAPLLTRWMGTTVSDVISDYAEQVDKGQYPGDEEWLELDHPLMGHLIQAHEERGLDAALPRLVEALTARGISAGHGGDSFASLIEVIERRSA
jgi:3-hydroxyisobutyrate dehydrogenase-like beta-hydroxyacid dehydrogenase